MEQVTQADRNAAAAWMEIDGHGWADTYIDLTLTGGSDDGQLVQAFARHRIAHSPSADPALREALEDIGNERQRQITAEGWTPEHDDEHRDDQALPRAAACYALAGIGASGPFWITHLQTPQQVWPYRWEWKPKDRRANLVRAGALIVAEIERFDRAALVPPLEGDR